MPKTGRPWGQDTSESTGPLGTDRPGAVPPESVTTLLPGATAASNNVGPVEITLITSKKDGPEITQAGGEDSGAEHGGVSTQEPSTATPTHMQVSAAESSWPVCLLSYGVVMSAFWVVVLFQ